MCSMVLFGLLAQWLERHPYEMCGRGSIPGWGGFVENRYRSCLCDIFGLDVPFGMLWPFFFV